VALEADVSFDTNGALSGFTHTPSSSQVVATVAGTYSVRFSVTGIEPNQFAVFKNGVFVPGSLYGSGNSTQQNQGEVIVDLAAGDVLTLRNHTSSSAVGLQPLAGGTQVNVNAALIIEGLD
jgi:hypothetical protein